MRTLILPKDRFGNTSFITYDYENFRFLINALALAVDARRIVWDSQQLDVMRYNGGLPESCPKLDGISTAALEMPGKESVIFEGPEISIELLTPWGVK